LIYEAIDAGVRNIGENRVQEALCKYDPVEAYAEKKGIHLTWHMIGHLQTNKAKEAVRIFDLIHSVDSERLAAEIDRQAAGAKKVQDILLEVNVSQESTKCGFSCEEAVKAGHKIAALKNVRLKGLMTIAPIVDDCGKARPYFQRLRELKEKMNQSVDPPLTVLSMGMTDDFQVAVQEGATMVRIGRGIFEGRH
jgi:pyridoxal phosphate enzyme (YggS family)